MNCNDSTSLPTDGTSLAVRLTIIDALQSELNKQRNYHHEPEPKTRLPKLAGKPLMSTELDLQSNIDLRFLVQFFFSSQMTFQNQKFLQNRSIRNSRSRASRGITGLHHLHPDLQYWTTFLLSKHFFSSEFLNFSAMPN